MFTPTARHCKTLGGVISKTCQVLSALCLVFIVACPVAGADCQTTYKQAVQLLDTTTQKSVKPEQPDPEDFSEKFKALVTSLQTQNCMPELMSLIQHIHAEQQKLPVATPVNDKTKPPITD
jgi:hypothetical protein